MSFKYLYCFKDSNKENLYFCYMPLDRYTIGWYIGKAEPNIKAKLKKIKNAWSKMSKELFFEIQNDIDRILKDGCKYLIDWTNDDTIILPKAKLNAEFIIWQQEKLNKIHDMLIKYKDYYNRLGIEEKQTNSDEKGRDS